ncbi:ABC transporter substrate-binding protein [Sporomusa sp. KB1]|jgi:peptide/nickel transport system substrate-binding protein|uniref:ABC transporter substrate-binding protein n=1 Tax=Sporomusa sp. KB1 TaxID=943346 RepID=UPI0011A2A1A4|nr:ABC transporter substrate-binding protein [Sporomusa sp. KB1]TWH51660.1 peptide/nickel transport system substrate-binding protein [Sporomusa sp. KB1]TWH52239.1 peptide/nickel transport system substrate-binding protein [Sporomusa sp. KB1]
MKKNYFTTIIALLLCTCLILTGCGKSSSPEANKSKGAKEIVVAIYRDGALSELDAASYNGPHFLYKMLYEGFVEDGGEGKILPQLATSWDISPDGKTYTFKLRQGVKFSDGTDFNAAAIIFNLKRWVNNDRHAILSAANVESMEALDDYTVKIVFKSGAYPILTELTYPRPVRFLSPASIAKMEGNDKGKFVKPVGTGPWMVESYTKDQEFTLVPNPYYWGEKPKVDKITFKVITDAQARSLALQSGEIDILGGDLIGKIPMESLIELKKTGKFDIYTKGSMCSHFIAFNQKVEAFQDKNVRLAMNYAINKPSIAANLFDNIGAGANGLYQPGIPYTTNENNYGFANDKEKAKQLLEAAGYTDTDGDGIREKSGKKLEFNFVLSTGEFPEWKQMAEFVQAEFSAVGIKVNLKILDKNGYEDATMNTKAFDIALMRTSSDSWVPHGSSLEMFSILATSKAAKVWYDEELYNNIVKTLCTLDKTERQKNYDTVFKFISEEALTIPIYYPITSFAVNTNKIKGFEIGVNNYAPIEWQKLDVK